MYLEWELKIAAMICMHYDMISNAKWARAQEIEPYKANVSVLTAR